MNRPSQVANFRVLWFTYIFLLKILHQSEAERNGKQQKHDTDKYLYEAHGNFAEQPGTDKCGERSGNYKTDSSLAFQNCKISGKEC